MNDKTIKTYTLHTSAPFHIARELAIRIAMNTGHMTELSEAPEPAPTRQVWGRGRWFGVIFVLGSSPFFFAAMPESMSALQGFGIGWATAAFVLLTRR